MIENEFNFTLTLFFTFWWPALVGSNLVAKTAQKFLNFWYVS